MEIVRVAPEGEWEAPIDSITARAMLGELNRFFTGPVGMALLCDLTVTLSEIDHDVDEKELAGFQDVFTQQQLIGEKRGLRQFFVKLNTIHERIKEIADKP